ncbi:MAG TPA: glycosyl hydrolase [Thermomicrobiales bacterium]|nr:glycosyl hydrolase [Thermomicrobiales bacterium]
MAAVGVVDDNLFRSLEWRCIGPHRGGRVVAVAGHPTERGTFFFGACAGGIWKTTSGGALWENVSDGHLGTAAIGAIAVSDSDPNVLYAGTGEAAIRSNVSHGDGVYKSTDGGRTWTNVGLKDTRHIGDLVIHPKNPDVAYVAALGHAWGRNEERGVFRTRDGGKTWQKVLYKSDRAGAVDLALDPHHPDVLYASIWQAQRYPYALSSGGEDSGLWKSTDGGETWTDISRNPGLPKGLLGKIGVAASPAQAGRVWALIEAAGEDGKDGGGLFRSDDWGATWQAVCGEADLRRRPWYYMHIFADPQHADTVWVLNLNCWKSTDGGKSFITVPTPHGDNHGLWIDPRDSERLIESHDGGACVSFDGGRAWSSVLNQPTAQFYHVTADDQVPYHVYGPQQDNWAMRLPTFSAEGAISWKDYVEPGGGESGYLAVSPKPPHLVFGGGIGTGAGHGRLIAWNPETGQKRNVTVWPEVYGSGAGAKDLKYRFQWTFPVEISPHDPDSLYICSNHVHRSTDDGTSWEVISPDLTRNDPDTLQPSGGPITFDNSGAEIYATIFAFRESPHEAGVFWAGSDDGLVHVSRDGGKSWQNVTPPENLLPQPALISIIEPSPHDAATVYVAATRYKHDDTKPYLLKTSDYGQTWQLIVGGIADDEFTRTIREDPGRRGLLYSGTETGVYVSFNDGANWQRLRTNLPVVPIHDLIVKGTDLVAATHGRSFWILDDVTPLHQVQDGRAGEAAHLFKPRVTRRYRHYGRAFGSKTPGYVSYKMTGPVTVAYRQGETAMGTKTEEFLDAGKNPPDGAIVHYTLKEKPEQPVTLTFKDARGNVARTVTSDAEQPPRVPVAPGANRFVWDLRYDPPTKLEDEGERDEFAAMMAGATAPRALPGEYRVELTIGDTTLAETFTVEKDPRLAESDADLAAQFELKGKIRDRISEVHETVNRLRRIRKQVDEWAERARAADGHQDVADAADALKERLAAIENELVQTEKNNPRPGLSKLKDRLATLGFMIDESDAAPTQGAYEVFDALSERVAAQRAALDEVVSRDLPAFTERVRAADIPPIVA